MKYKRISREKAVQFLIDSKTGTEPVWFKTNINTEYSRVHTDILQNGDKRIKVYNAVDAGKVYFKHDKNGNKFDIYGFEECKYAYILA